jgi:predicted 3-demethylubiquinone-9 3-methyltransferase (glyoxalase superfamily)
MQLKQRIIPFLTYKNQAHEAAEFYVSLLPDSKINRIVRPPNSDSVLTVGFELCGLQIVALNAAQDWQFTEAFSLCVTCDDQEEIDRLWEGLLADGGNEMACGWLKDKFGMCWQIVPAQLERWIASDKPENLQRMFQSLWQMKKLDIATLQNAFDARE